MRFLRSVRGLAVLGLLMTVVGLTLWVVLPALAATSTGYSGASTAVAPTYLASGGENDCALFTAHGATIGTDQYFASNPKAISGKTETVTASNGMTVSLKVTVDKSYTHLDFSISGGVVTDVGIKGGNGTDWYSYESNPGGGVTHDAGLTAPAQTAPGTAPFYGLSQTVFCYTPKITCQANVPLSDPQHPGGTIELPSCAGKDNVFFDFNSGTSNGKNFVSVYAYGGSGTPNTPMVEHITGTLSGSTQTTLQYSDLNPAVTLHDMRYCRLDPRAGGNDQLRLASPAPDPSSVLQPDDPSDPENTSCLISEHAWVDSNGHVQFEAYIYSEIDGYQNF
jgi:hypothetical protein